MKKLSLGLFLALAAAVVWPAAGLALTPQALQPLASATSRAAHQRYSPPASLRAAVNPASVPGHVPGRFMAARAATGPCTVTGTVLDYSGAPVAQAEVDLYNDAGGTDRYLGYVLTDANGAFSLGDVPETTAGEIDVFLADGSGYQSWYKTFTAAGPNDFTLQPGLTGAKVLPSTDSNWTGFTSFRLETWGSVGGGTTIINGDSGLGYVMPPDYDYAVAYPWPGQGIEWSAASSMSALPGVTDANTMVFDQADGRGAWVGSPWWASGKPGTKAVLVLENWPLGYEMEFYGESDAPTTSVKNYSSEAQSDGSQYGFQSLTVPTTATPGYFYELHTYRVDDPSSALDVTSYFEVATLKASHTSVTRGGAVRLSGIIPTQGHMGSIRGKSKTVTVYQRTKAAGPPTVWNAAAKGWHKVVAIKANGLGKYTSRLLHPKRTTWYIVRFPGDGWYWGAYTSVLKITVK
jgi:hypothetical protein